VPTSDPRTDHIVTLLGIAFQLKAIIIHLEAGSVPADLLTALQEIRLKVISENIRARVYKWVKD
jgi:hypothetical protein